VVNALPWQQQQQQQQHAAGAPPAPAAPPSELSVRQFGARGDGVTPDDAAIQTAIDAAAAYSRNGTGSPTVYFPRGVYLLTKTLKVVSAAENSTLGPIRLTGDGRQASHVIAGQGLRAGSTMLQYGSPAGFVEGGEVSALGFDAKGIAVHCITAYARHSTFAGLLLQKGTGGQVHFVAGQDNTVTGSHFDCGASSSDSMGVCLQSRFASDGVSIVDNVFTDFTSAVSLAGGANVRLHGNDFTGLTPANRSKAATLILSGISGLAITSNKFQTGGSNGSKGMLCADIQISGASTGSTGNPCSGVVISANVFDPAGYEHVCAPYSAIFLAAASRVSVSDNTISNAPNSSWSYSNLLGTGGDASKFYTADIDVHGSYRHVMDSDGRTQLSSPVIDLRLPVAGGIANGFGESNFHTFTSPAAFMRNFAMGAVPATWVPLGGVARPDFGDRSGQRLDGGEWSSRLPCFICSRKPVRPRVLAILCHRAAVCASAGLEYQWTGTCSAQY
jgi:hypothetical protein